MSVGIKITNLGRAQLSIEAWKRGIGSWWGEFSKYSLKTATALKSKAESWSPVDTGKLEQAGMSMKMIPYSDWVNLVYTIWFTPEYAEWIETQKWGPAAGNDYRRRTGLKAARLGTPIGPRFIRRSAAAFAKDLDSDLPVMMTGLPNLGIKIKSKGSIMKKGMIFGVSG